jgi:hypothetical membrane protein
MTNAARRRAGVIAAFLGVGAIALGSIVAAVAYTGNRGEPYSPLNHWVSELGQVGVSELSTVFNLGLVVGGASFAAFMALLAASSVGRLRWAWGTIGVVAGVAGLFVGVFPMNLPDFHALAALTFFNLGWIAVGITTFDLLRRRDPRFPRWLGIVAGLTIAAFIGFLVSLRLDTNLADDPLGAPPVRPDFWIVPTLEWAVIAGILAWSLLVGLSWWRSR